MVLKYFSKDQIKVYNFEQLKKEPEIICKDLHGWGQPHEVVCKVTSGKEGSSSGRPLLEAAEAFSR